MFKLVNNDATMAHQAGYRTPVQLSAAVKTMVDAAIAHNGWLNDWNGVLWDILQMSTNRQVSAAIPADETARSFSVIITGVNSLLPGESDLEEHLVHLVSQCGPTAIGDPSPCITIMTRKEYESRRAFNYWWMSGRLGWSRGPLN